MYISFVIIIYRSFTKLLLYMNIQKKNNNFYKRLFFYTHFLLYTYSRIEHTDLS